MVVAERAAMAAMTESTTTMSTEVVDYTNFDEQLMMGYVLDELPVFVRKFISNRNFPRSLPHTTI